MQTHVSFLGFVPDVPQRIRSWHALVHASTAPDPCPNVVLEAMAAGVPVVGANGGGVPELLDEGRCGALFPMDDPDALRQQLEDVFGQPHLRAEYAAKGRQRALKLFVSERVAREVAAVWETVWDAGVYRRRRWAWLEDELVPTRSRASVAASNSGEELSTEPKGEEALPVAP